MPVYVYKCDICGEQYELHRHYGAPHPTACPKGHEGLHRVFSPPTISFKGSGFYVTDNASKNGRMASKEKETKEKEPAKSEKTDTKAEKKDTKTTAKGGEKT